MYKNLLKKPWMSQAVLNTIKGPMCGILPKLIKKGRTQIDIMFAWSESPQGWHYWHSLNIEN